MQPEQPQDQPIPPLPAQPAPVQPGQPGQPVPGYAPQMENPGQTTGIIGLVLNFLGISIGGIILGIISRNKSKEAGMSTTIGTVSLVWGIVATVLAVLAIGFFIIIAVIAASTETPSTLNDDYSPRNSYYSNES